MADAWGRLTGEPGIVLLTGGPGHANGVGARHGVRIRITARHAVGPCAAQRARDGFVPGDATGGDGRSRRESSLDC